jgi:glycosyltransferase involved in cell wall biosynthesis
LNILVVTQYFWPESFRVNDLVLGLQQRGHRVEVLTGMPNYPTGRLYPGYHLWSPATESFQGVPIKRVPLAPRGSGKYWRLAVNYASFAVSASVLGPIRCRARYDVIFVYEPSPITVAIPGILLGALKECPVLLWVQDLWPESLSATGAIESPRLLRLIRRLVDFIYRRCDLVLVSSKGFIDHVLASGVDAGRVIHFPNWAESVYRPLPAAPASLQAKLPEGFTIMFAGNIGSAQSFETIVAAAERLRGQPAIHWVILGEGTMKSWVAEQIKLRGLEGNVHLLGQRPMDSMPAYFAAADALLVTLRADPVFALTVPSKIQSYLACAKPIIASINGEGADIIAESGAGISCPAGDPDRLADSVLSIFRAPRNQRIAMGKRGRAYFESHFERELLLTRLEMWMLDLAEKWPRAS